MVILDPEKKVLLLLSYIVSVNSNEIYAFSQYRLLNYENDEILRMGKGMMDCLLKFKRVHNKHP